jgi:hypothetical protein
MAHSLVSLLKSNDVALIQCGCLICSIANGSPIIIMNHQNLTKPEFYSMCRAAFMCGREPNFELSEEEKQELRKYTWEDFLAITRNTITSKSMTQNFNFLKLFTPLHLKLIACSFILL